MKGTYLCFSISLHPNKSNPILPPVNWHGQVSLQLELGQEEVWLNTKKKNKWLEQVFHRILVFFTFDQYDSDPIKWK